MNGIEMSGELENTVAEYLGVLLDLGVREARLTEGLCRDLSQFKAAEAVKAPLVKEAPKKVHQTGLSAEEKARALEHLAGEIRANGDYRRMFPQARHMVFGVGNPAASIMFVGEAPGVEEDEQGEPFVGKAGQLLNKMIQAMGLQRGDVYIGNIVKYRPEMPPGSTGNRKPTLQEIQISRPYICEQIAILQPRVLVALGATAMEGLFPGEKISITRGRGQWMEFEGIPLMPTYHPAYLLRNQSNAEKRKVWEDLMQVMEKAGMNISDKQRNFFLSKDG